MKTVSHEDQPQEEWRAGVQTRMHVSARNGATQLCIFEQRVEPAVGAPTHWHPVEEVLTVIAGKAEMWIDEERIVLIAGSPLLFPRTANMAFETPAPKRFISMPCSRHQFSRRRSTGPPRW
ncbi:cupin domain-containing protein [Mesorhizobium sp.]|uniref:cupin domain-containing protein n=1 Tax=Mesorhizobium sp. TaxID=1871066 RepID=UPI00338E803A